MDPYLEPYWLDVYGTLITLDKPQLHAKHLASHTREKT
jgi:hypothetical protein